MTKPELPGWFGWPSGELAPGHDWLPGPKLRILILTLAYIFLAFSLTVNYAASITFFLLAIIGMYIGFRRGFTTGLTVKEKVLMLIFFAYPIVAIISYLHGTQTYTGFRFLGRELRFVLFVPIYLSLRWSRPRVTHLAILFGLGVIISLADGISQITGTHLKAIGVASIHITFGDISLLIGFLASSIFITYALFEEHFSSHSFILTLLSTISLSAGIASSVAAESRGGWIALPVFFFLIIYFSKTFFQNTKIYFISCLGAFLILSGTLLMTPKIKNEIIRAYTNLALYKKIASPQIIKAKCVDDRVFLTALLEKSDIKGSGTVKIIRLPSKETKLLRSYGCKGKYALFIQSSVDSKTRVKLRLFRGHGKTQKHEQTVTFIAKGTGWLNIGWKKPWAVIKARNRWEKYVSTHSYVTIVRAIASPTLGGHVYLIPAQDKTGAFAYPLMKSSLGQRILMWRAATRLFLSAPALGSGTGSFKYLSHKALSNPILAPAIGHYEHAHSDYFTKLGTNGITGLIALICLLFGPILSFPAKNKMTRETFAARISILVTCSSFAIFGLTETMFSHSLVISSYIVIISVLVSIAYKDTHTVSRNVHSTY